MYNRGGKRENSGRKRVKNGVRVNLMVTAENVENIKKIVKETNQYEKD